jgi:TRAP-type C4-dicarboxylate transport system substrate-binding protein
MERKKLLKRTVYMSIGLMVGLLWSNSFTLPVHAQIKLTYAAFPPAPTYQCVQMERWKTEVEKRTNGKVKVDTYPGGTLLGAMNMFEGVISGIADIGFVVLSYHPGRFPLNEIMEVYPRWPNTTVGSAVYWDLYEKYNFDSLKKVKVLCLNIGAPAKIMSMKPIRSLEDLKGYELRTAGMGIKALELLGAKPIGMPMSEVPEALQKGIIKGLVTSAEVMQDFKFAEYLRFVTKCNLYTLTAGAVMNKSKWDSLPSDVKKVIDDMRKEHSIWIGKYYDNREEEALKWSKDKYNVEVINLSSKELARWQNLVKPLSDHYMKVKEGEVTGEEFYKEMVKLAEKYSKLYAK